MHEQLDGSLKIVSELQDAIPATPQEQQSLFTKQWIARLKAHDAQIVISFIGLPTISNQAGQTDRPATLRLWNDPAYQSLQWVLPCPYGDLPADSFSDGRVIAAVWPRPHEPTNALMPAYLEKQGTPAELFKAWFKLETGEGVTNPP